MNFVDQIISEIDKGIKFSLDNYQKENRQYPAANITDDSLSELKTIAHYTEEKG